MTEVELADILRDHKGRIGSLEHRMDNVEKLTESVNNLTLTTSNLVIEVKHTNENVTDLKTHMENLTAQPGKRLGQIKTAIISALATAVIAAVISAVLMIIK